MGGSSIPKLWPKPPFWMRACQGISLKLFEIYNFNEKGIGRAVMKGGKSILNFNTSIMEISVQSPPRPIIGAL